MKTATIAVTVTLTFKVALISNTNATVIVYYYINILFVPQYKNKAKIINHKLQITN